MIEFAGFWLVELLRATLVLSVAVPVTSYILRLTKSKPQTRVMAWMLVLAPCWLLFSFALEIPWLESTPKSGVTSEVVWSNPSQTLNSTSALTNQSAKIPTEANSAQSAALIKILLMIIWASGILVLIFKYFRSYLCVHCSLTGTVKQGCSEHLLHAPWFVEFEEAIREVGLRQDVHFTISSDLGPMLCWYMGRNHVVVPQAFWIASNSQQRSAILHHELAHAKRNDVWWILIARILILAQWFNPLAWYALRQFCESVEMACDDEVLKHSKFGRFEYAKSLVSLVEFNQSDVSFGLPAIGPPVQQRIQRIVHPNGVEMKFAKMLAIGLLVLVSSFNLVRPELVAQNSNFKANSSLTERGSQPSATGFGERSEKPGDEANLTIVTYEVSDLILPLQTLPQKPPQAGRQSQQLGGITLSDFMPLKNLITNTVASDSWGQNGRVIMPFVQNLSLVVCQAPAVHDQIQDLLRKLRELNRFSIELKSFVALFPKDSDLLPAELGKNGRPIEFKDVQRIRNAGTDKTIECVTIPEAELLSGQSVVYQNLNQALWSVEGISISAIINSSLKNANIRLAGMTELVLCVPQVGTPDVVGKLVELEKEMISDLNEDGIGWRVGVYPSARVQDNISTASIKDGEFLALDVSSMLNDDRQDRRAILIINARIIDNQKQGNN